MRRYDFALAILALAGLCAAVLPILGLLFAMTGFGIPVAFAFWALPALAFILGSARILQRAVLDRLAPRGLGTVNVSLSIALVLGGLAGAAALDRRNQAEAPHRPATSHAPPAPKKRWPPSNVSTRRRRPPRTPTPTSSTALDIFLLEFIIVFLHVIICNTDDDMQKNKKRIYRHLLSFLLRGASFYY